MVSEVKPYKSAYLQKQNLILKRHSRYRMLWKLPQGKQWSYKEQHLWTQHMVVHTSTTKPGKRPCYYCGGKHSPNDCRYKDQQCNKCNKQGHIAKMCRSGNNTSRTRVTKCNTCSIISNNLESHTPVIYGTIT